MTKREAEKVKLAAGDALIIVDLQNLTVVSVAPWLAAAIQRLAARESISDLFQSRPKQSDEFKPT